MANPAAKGPMPTSSAGKTNRQPLPGVGRRGVTLVEMVVVVAIIALIVGISFPAASAGLDNVRMVSAVDSVATFLNAAVNRAERRQQPIELVIFPVEGRLDRKSTRLNSSHL